ncbi:MAG TPA: ABC transporter permease [Pseudonocardia sp.]|jgi:ribose transport system permease protein|uniref:ABC transporter permease n=1 Tax=Pseudonocardia sp. TaxID=60912 RepID=UPI002B4B1A30|nr:ABC transporter permease [Pseudonocardia sp.]HLU56911.1 ABC transporter permease [Pseudonocardia sp.]
MTGTAEMTSTRTAQRTGIAALRDPALWADRAAAVGLVALVLVFQLLDPGFLAIGNVRSMLLASAILVVLSIGQAFVVATGGIDLSVASTMTFAAALFGYGFAHGWGLALCCVVAVAGGAVVGILNGILIGYGRITDFVVTLGALSAASGAALVIADGKPVTVVDAGLLALSARGIGPIGWSVIVAAVLAVVGHVVLFRTRIGTHVLAAGGNPEAATATGISVARIKVFVYAASGLLAGIAAILLVSRVGAAEPASNTSFLLNSVAAVVLGGVSLAGGRGGIVGPVLGALLLTVLSNGLTMLGVSPFYQPVAVGVVVVAAAFLTRWRR